MRHLLRARAWFETCAVPPFTQIKIQKPTLDVLLEEKIVTIQSELLFYQNKGYKIYYYPNWNYFKSLDGNFTEVSKERLRIESSKVMNAISHVLIFTVPLNEVFWVSGVGYDEKERYVFYWRPMP